MSLSFSEKKWTRPEFFKLVVDLYTLYGLVCFYFIQKSRKNRRLRLFATAQNPCSVHWQQKTQKNASLGMKLAFFSTALKIQCGVFLPIFWDSGRGHISSHKEWPGTDGAVVRAGFEDIEVQSGVDATDQTGAIPSIGGIVSDRGTSNPCHSQMFGNTHQQSTTAGRERRRRLTGQTLQPQPQRHHRANKSADAVVRFAWNPRGPGGYRSHR